MSHVAWPEIESFHNVRKSVQKYPELLGGQAVVRYRPKVKIHGTNAAVQVRGKTVLAQSRTQIVTVGQDNAGFAKWVDERSDRWRQAFDVPTIVFGEWCGPGIMRGTAANQIPDKVFAVFGAHEIRDDASLDADPSVLRRLESIPGVHVIGWADDAIDIPILGEAEEVQPILDRINARVLEVEARDPWIADAFGVSGVGEGLVYYPIGVTSRKMFSDLVFKAKGEKHKIVAKSAPVQVDPSVAASIEEFASMVLTEARLEQGARAAARGELTYEKRLMGPFIAWICGDVEKETASEREASGLTWKQVQRAVSDRARSWYLANAERIA